MSAMIIDEVLAQPQPVSWLPWAVQYFFFIGIAASAALIAGVARWIKGDLGTALERSSLFIALTCGVTGPLALMADLHQPARFLNFYLWFSPWSWMPWGALLLPLFLLLLVLWFLTSHFGERSGRFTTLCAMGAGIMAIGLLIYTGREVSVVQARPAWFSYWFPLAMFLSGLQALFALLRILLRQQTSALRWLKRSQFISLLLLGITLLSWSQGDSLSGEALRQAWQLNDSLRLTAQLCIGFWVVAILCTLFTTERQTLTLLALLSSLALCWLLRWSLLIGGQMIPKYNAVVNSYQMPYGPEGLLAIIGTFGLWFALIITLREGLNWLSLRKQHG